MCRGCFNGRLASEGRANDVALHRVEVAPRNPCGACCFAPLVRASAPQFRIRALPGGAALSEERFDEMGNTGATLRGLLHSNFGDSERPEEELDELEEEQTRWPAVRYGPILSHKHI